MARTKSDALGKAKAKPKPKSTAVKAKPKTKRKVAPKDEKETPNPHDTPPDHDQASLNRFWSSTIKTGGLGLPAESSGVSVQDGRPVESSAGAQPTADSVGGGEPPVATQQLEQSLVDICEKETLPATDVPCSVDQDNGNDNDNEHAVARLNESSGTAGNDVSPAIQKERDEIPVRDDAMEMTNDKDESSMSSAASSSFADFFMTKGSINLSRGKEISLSEVAQFFRGYEINSYISDWKQGVKVLVSKILTAEEVTLLVEQGRKHPQIADHEMELNGSVGGNHDLNYKPCDANERLFFGSDPDRAFEDVEELILWLVPSENDSIRLVNQSDPRECGSFFSALHNEHQMKEPEVAFDFASRSCFDLGKQRTKTMTEDST